MNEILDVCFFYWVRTNFLLKKCLILMILMNALQTNRPTDQPTNQPTDTAYYRDARTHLKMTIFHFNFKNARGANYRKYGNSKKCQHIVLS